MNDKMKSLLYKVVKKRKNKFEVCTKYRQMIIFRCDFIFGLLIMNTL